MLALVRLVATLRSALEERFAPAPAMPAATMPAGRRLAHPRASLRTATHARPARTHTPRRNAAQWAGVARP